MSNIIFETKPSIYKHWKIEVQNNTAWLTMNVNEDEGLFQGYRSVLGTEEEHTIVGAS